MAKLTLSDLASGYGSATTYNANNDLIETALENTLSRDGTTPNTMSANLDMNSNKVVNVTDPTNAQDAATKAYVDAVEATIAGGTYLENVVEDTTPQLGGNLDVNGKKITSTANGNIDIEPDGTGNVLLGNLTIDADQTVGAGQDNYVLTYDNGTGLVSLEAAAAGGISNVVEDTTPQLGGALDAQANAITDVDRITLDLLLDQSAAAPAIAFGDGDTGFYEGSDDLLYVTCGGVAKYYFGSLYITGTGSGSFYLTNETASRTNPTLGPRRDLGTGIGSGGTQEFSLIADSTEMMRIDASGSPDYIESFVEVRMGDNFLIGPRLEDYSLTSTTPTISSGSITFNMNNSNAFQVSLTENITSITISNPPASGSYGELIIKFVQDATGSRTVAGWPAAVKWPGGTAPTITTTATTGTDIVTLKTWDAGTTWLGDYSQDYS